MLFGLLHSSLGIWIWSDYRTRCLFLSLLFLDGCFLLRFLSPPWSSVWSSLWCSKDSLTILEQSKLDHRKVVFGSDPYIGTLHPKRVTFSAVGSHPTKRQPREAYIISTGFGVTCTTLTSHSGKGFHAWYWDLAIYGSCGGALSVTLA